MSETNDTTAQPEVALGDTPEDAAVAAREQALKDGWMNSAVEDAPKTSPSETKTAADKLWDEFEQVEKPFRDGWQIGEQPKVEEPPPAEPEFDNRAIASQMGVDYEAATQFLRANDWAAYEALKEQGLIVEAKDETDLRRNIAAVELARSRTEQALYAREQALAEAIELYESGEAEPAAIADQLGATYGQAAATEFLQYWHEDENGWDDGVPQTATQYVEAIAEQARIAAQQQQQAFYAHAQQESHQRVEAAAARFDKLAASSRMSEEVQEAALGLLTGMVQQGATQEIGAPNAFVDMVLRAAQEDVRARQLAKFYASWDEAGPEPGGYPFTSDQPAKKTEAEYYAELLNKSLENPAALMSAPPAAERLEKELDDALFGRDSIYEEGWRIGK